MFELQFIIIGLVQGITEFLPISSSAHLILISELTSWEDQGLFTDIAVHIGTLGAVIVYLFSHIKKFLPFILLHLLLLWIIPCWTSKILHFGFNPLKKLTILCDIVITLLKHNLLKKYYIPNLFCFGDFERDFYKKLNIIVKNIYPVGNLRWANFLNHIKYENDSHEKYNSDICLIFQTADHASEKKKKRSTIFIHLSR